MKWFTKKHYARSMWPMVAVLSLPLIDSQAVGQCQLDLLASDGAVSDRFGFSVSISGAPGNEVAIVGAYLNNVTSSGGAAYIYRKSGMVWVEEAKLLASDGAASDQFGYSVSISGIPGNEIAIVGAYRNDDNGTNSGSAYIYRFNGAIWVEEQKLLASDAAFGDLFGQAVSISGTPGNEVAIVGAYGDDDNGADSGSAYIYRFNGATWVEEPKLIASDGAAGDLFGISVSISGTTGNELAIVSAPQHDDNGTDSGSAYIFRKSGASWVEEAKLLASDGSASDWFGVSVSISGTPGNEVAIVGAWYDDDSGSDSGSAYIYRYNGVSWVEEPKLLASDGAAVDYFGRSVSISGDPGNELAIVGAFWDDDNGPSSGSAYIYRYNGVNWAEESKLLASGGAASDVFGFSVSISGDVAIVGAYGDDDNGIDSGSACIFTGLFISALSNDCNSNGLNDLIDLFLHKTSADCNSNGIPDECDIASGVSVDVDVDGIPDECIASCPADNNGDGNVNVTDLLALLAAWGVCP